MLTNVKFDNSFKNGCYFSNKRVRELALHPANFDSAKKMVNFNKENILFTRIVSNNYNNENYCIVHNDETNEYYYYFIYSVEYNAVNQWTLSLELDVITQYLTGANSQTFSNCNIIRGHCNRWITEKGYAMFDVSGKSQIIKPETKIDKINKVRKKVKLKWFNNLDLDDWFATNILCWMYLFVDKEHEYTALGYQGSTSSTLVPVEYKSKLDAFENVVGTTTLKNDFACICFPVYNSINKIIVKDEGINSQCIIDMDSINNFYLKNNGSQYVYNIKLSMVPPADFSSTLDFDFDDGNLVVYAPMNQNGATNQGWRTGAVDVDAWGDLDIVNGMVTLHGGFVNVWQQFNLVDSDPIDTKLSFTFPISDLKGSRNVKYEPKVLLDCYKMVLRDSSNGEYNYNPLHVGHRQVKVLYTEGLNITNNNYYYRIESTGLIPASSQDDWTGVVNTVDYSQTVANNNIDAFLSNNKNFLLTKGANIGLPLVASVLAGNLAGVGGAVGEALKTYIEYDNLGNKANSLRNANDSATLNMLVNDGLQLYVDIESATECDIDAYYNYIYNYGYSINKIDNPFKYINTRRYFNYIQCDAEQINIDAPHSVKKQIKNILKSGIRLWNDYLNIYNYDMENYENYLDNKFLEGIE